MNPLPEPVGRTAPDLVVTPLPRFPLPAPRLTVTTTSRVYGPRTQPVDRDTGGCGTYPYGTWVMYTTAEVALAGLGPTVLAPTEVRWSAGNHPLHGPTSAVGVSTTTPEGNTGAQVIVDYTVGSAGVRFGVRSAGSEPAIVPVTAEVVFVGGSSRTLSATFAVHPDLVGFLPDDALEISLCEARRRLRQRPVERLG
ncbi:hypothetical protein [Luteimicrobium subarcticum]|uniref:Uncharacterized protein n=1 Tax=Luteimicrobium subarcticum TaxID=620910 RepID=A0A2M8W6H9_9MICO|nr:hypothetical protein [Luteimicrobium subarcticum]PJI86537.1 hypothetical protein CLV34_2453 [Luteimicrobium subarcticum]